MSILRKIQNQPEHIRKAIFWILVIVLAIALLFFWLRITEKRIKSFQGVDNFKKIEYSKNTNGLYQTKVCYKKSLITSFF